MEVLFILNKKQVLFTLLLCLITIFLVASVSAIDFNDTEVITDEATIDEMDILEINNDNNNLQTDNGEVILESSVDNILEVVDDEETLGVNYQQFSDIQKKINSANPGDTVYINGTYYGFGYPILINKPIKLVGMGDGAVLKANTNTNLKQCAIYINQSDVTIDNIKIYNGCDQWGGGIYIECADYVEGYYHTLYKRITISNCLFKDNSADGNHGYGGAICYWSEDSEIINCTFINNHCTDFGGAIYANGQNNKITNCKFTYNYISNEISEQGLEICRGGGAIYNDCQSLKIDNCVFIENSAREAYGGALRLAASCSVKNSVFDDNSAYLAKAVFCGSEIIIFSKNTFSLDYKEDPNTLFKGVTADELKATNTFNKTRIDSSVKFSAGMVFEYGTSGSIYVTVEGGNIEASKIKVLGHGEAKIDFKDNVISVSNLPVGLYTLRVTTVPDDDHLSVDSDLKVTVKKATAVIIASKLTVALKKGTLWTVKLVNSKTNKPISNMKLSLKLFTGKKFKTVTLTTNSNGEASYQTKSLSKGKHKVVVSGSHEGFTFNTVTSSIKVIKPKALKFTLKKRVNDKDGSLISYLVKDKKTNKGVNGVRISFKIYTGKTVKTITLKTKKIGKSNGAVGLATNELSVGKHKVVIEPADIKYKGSTKTTMIIKKSAKKIPNYLRKL